MGTLKFARVSLQKEIKEEIELRVEDYLTMGEDVEILSVEDTIEEKFGELVPVLEQRLKEHTKFLIEKQKSDFIY